MALGAPIGPATGPERKNRKFRFHKENDCERQKCRAAGENGQNGPFCGRARPESQSWGPMRPQPQLGLKIRLKPLSGSDFAGFGLKSDFGARPQSPKRAGAFRAPARRPSKSQKLAVRGPEIFKARAKAHPALIRAEISV